MSTAAAAETGPTPDETIRRTVRALRSAYEVDARDLARHLGISRQSLYNRLNGVAPWLAAEIVGLAQFFNCEIADFYTGNVRVDLAGAGRATGVATLPYRSASAHSRPALTLVRGAADGYRAVAAGNSSSTPPTVYTDDRHVPLSAKRVHNADAA